MNTPEECQDKIDMDTLKAFLYKEFPLEIEPGDNLSAVHVAIRLLKNGKALMNTPLPEKDCQCECHSPENEGENCEHCMPWLYEA